MLQGAHSPLAPQEHWMKPEDIAECVLFLLRQGERAVIREMIPWLVRHDQDLRRAGTARLC